MKLQIMSPAANRVNFKVPTAPRLASLEGKNFRCFVSQFLSMTRSSFYYRLLALWEGTGVKA